MLLLLSLLGEPPDETAQAVTTQHEHATQSGDFNQEARSSRRESALTSASPDQSMSGLTSAATKPAESALFV
jgi:endonuclease/exonuclease/phosphatase (EEP) superfamily protein YafD